MSKTNVYLCFCDILIAFIVVIVLTLHCLKRQTTGNYMFDRLIMEKV